MNAVRDPFPGQTSYSVGLRFRSSPPRGCTISRLLDQKQEGVEHDARLWVLLATCAPHVIVDEITVGIKSDISRLRVGAQRRGQ